MTQESSPKTHRKSHFLLTAEGKAYLLLNFSEKNKSTYEIAEELDTYPNKVRRALKAHNIPVKNRSEAQSAALSTGRAKHPTEGTERPFTVRNKIGDTLKKSWASLSPEKLQKFKDGCLDRWNKLSEKERSEFMSKAAKAVRKTADEGSKFEKSIYAALTTAGYHVIFHKERIIDYTEMHIDLFLQDEGIAIEVDGPSHFYPIYGEETLLKRIEADNKKNGILLNNGYAVVRVCDFGRFHSDASLREFNGRLLELLKEIKNSSSTEASDRYFEILFGKKRPDGFTPKSRVIRKNNGK